MLTRSFLLADFQDDGLKQFTAIRRKGMKFGSDALLGDSLPRFSTYVQNRTHGPLTLAFPFATIGFGSSPTRENLYLQFI
jgi:hypothetical protein